jgi:hypothetical protein
MRFCFGGVPPHLEPFCHVDLEDLEDLPGRGLRMLPEAEAVAEVCAKCSIGRRRPVETSWVVSFH